MAVTVPSWAMITLTRMAEDGIAQARPQALLLADHDPATVRAWLRLVCQHFDITSTELARRSGLPPATLNSFLSGGGVGTNLSANTIRKIEVAIAELMGNSEDGAAQTVLPTASVSVVGAVEAGAYMEALEWLPTDRYTVQVPTVALPRSFALEVRGESMNRFYPPGTVLICMSVLDLGRDPQNGAHVIVVRRRTGLVEATCKEWRADAGTVWLWPRSTSPEHQVPLRYDISPDDVSVDDEIAVIAVVTGSYSPRPTF